MSELNYPQEVLTMVDKMKAVVNSANQEMQILSANVKALAGASTSKTVTGFAQVHAKWQTLMDDHNDTLNRLALVAQDNYQQMMALDQRTAFQLLDQSGSQTMSA